MNQAPQKILVIHQRNGFLNPVQEKIIAEQRGLGNRAVQISSIGYEDRNKIFPHYEWIDVPAH